MQFGLESTPAMIYFEHGVPGLYSGNMSDSDELLSWLISKKKSDSLQLVSDEILQDVIDKFEYVAVLFTGFCKANNEECQKIKSEALSAMEEISDDAYDVGIVTVQDGDRMFVFKTYNISTFPSLLLFKNGPDVTPAQYEGDLNDPAQILNWLSSPETIEIPGQIEEVNDRMLDNIIESEDDVLVFFYDETDKNADDIIAELETVDDNLDSEAVEFVRCSEKSALDNYGLSMFPSLVYFHRGVPETYNGDLRNDDTILGWISKELREESLPEVKNDVLDSLLDRLEFVAVLYYDKNENDDQ